MDFPGVPPGSGLPAPGAAPEPAAAVAAPPKAAPAAVPAVVSSSSTTNAAKPEKKRSAASAGLAAANDAAGVSNKDLTEEQKLERRERNREHAKRSRLRKKFLLESLQEQIHGLEEQIERFKQAFKREMPTRAEDIIKDVCGDKEKYTPLPMPSGFGPVKTLMEPDFRLSKCLDVVGLVGIIIHGMTVLSFTWLAFSHSFVLAF